MSVLKQIFNDPSVVAVVSGLVAYLVAHLTGIIKVLQGGNISVQQVADAAKAIDPDEYARVVAELRKAKAEAEKAVSGFEARVQADVAAKLQAVVAKLGELPEPPPAPDAPAA